MLSAHIFALINNSFTGGRGKKKGLQLALNLMSPMEAATKLGWPARP